jgi:hypothetical protein
VGEKALAQRVAMSKPSPEGESLSKSEQWAGSLGGLSPPNPIPCSLMKVTSCEHFILNIQETVSKSEDVLSVFPKALTVVGECS